MVVVVDNCTQSSIAMCSYEIGTSVCVALLRDVDDSVETQSTALHGVIGH